LKKSFLPLLKKIILPNQKKLFLQAADNYYEVKEKIRTLENVFSAN